MKDKFSKFEQIVIAFLLCGLCFVGHLWWERQCDHVTDVDKKVEYKEVEMNVSAYCTCSKCCGDFADGITANGSPATGKLIAAPKTYAFGTRMDVPGYGTASVLDRGGAIKGNKLDLLFPDHQSALVWGRQQLTVKVYKEAK